MNQDGSDRRAGKLGLLLRHRGDRRWRRGTGHCQGSEEENDAHPAQNTAATSGLRAGKVGGMGRPLRLLAAGCVLVLLHPAPARA